MPRRSLALALALAACGTTSPPPADARVDDLAPLDVPPTPEDAPSDSSSDAAPGELVELGTGDRAFVALPREGGRVELVHGPQGGYHISGRIRFTAFAPPVRVAFRVAPAAGGAPITLDESPVTRAENRGLARWGAGWESAFEELAILDIRGPGEVVGRTYRFQVFVTEVATGRVATSWRVVTVVDATP